MHTRARLSRSLLAASLLACGGSQATVSNSSNPGSQHDAGAVLSRVDAVPPGADCAAGGKAVKSGLDADGDGVLSDAEVSATQLVCLDAAKTLLVRADVEAPGANCPNGGQAVKAGLDADGDGALSDSEVVRVSYLCGVAAPAPPAVLTRKAALAPGASCANGGARVDAGRDRDGDGVLSDSEVEQTVLVCDPPAAEPKPVLVRQNAAPFGACPGSGTVVRAGFDADSDGLLSDSEVTQATTVCSDTFPSFIVRTAADLALVAGATRIAGDLVIRETDFESAGIPAEVIDGSIVIESNPKLAKVELSVSLLGGGIAIRNNPVLKEARMASFDLEQIGGSLEIVDAPALNYVSGLDEVSLIRGSFIAKRTGFTSVLRMDRLAYVGGDVVVEENPLIQGWRSGIHEFAQGTIVAGGVSFRANNKLDLGPGRFRSIGGTLTFQENGLVYQWLDLSGLEHLGGLALLNNPTLVSVVAPSLKVIDGNFVAADNPILQLSSGWTHLQAVNGVVRIERNAGLSALNMIADIRIVGGIAISENPNLTYIGMAGVTSAGGITISRNASLTSIGDFGWPGNLFGLREVDSITIDENPALARLSLPSFHSAAVVKVRDNASLPSCAALALARQVTWPANPVVEISGNAGDAVSCP